MDPYIWPAGFMANQERLTAKMRLMLVDWLASAAQELKLEPQTYFQGVSIIDRYLEVAQVARDQFQLVGVAAMYAASKQGSVEGPTAHAYADMTDNAYTQQEVEDMADTMVKALDSDVLLSPTPFTHLTSFLDAIGAGDDEKMAQVCTYLLEVAAVYAVTASHTAPVIAAAAIEVALRLCHTRQDPYPEALAEASGVSRAAVLPCAFELSALWIRVQELPNTLEVYAKFCKTNEEMCEWEGPWYDIEKEAEEWGVEL